MMTKFSALRVFTLILFYFVTTLSFAQETETDTVVKWLRFDEAFKLQQENPKYIFLYVYDNAGKDAEKCKLMNDSTFADKSVIAFLNKRFYPVRVDARMRDSIIYFGEKFAPSDTSLIHPLITDILAGDMQFPSVAFYDKDLRKSVIPGYTDEVNLLPLLVYILEEAFESTSLDDFKKYFFKTYPPDNKTGYSMVRSIVKWKTLDEAFELSKHAPRKIFLIYEVNWSTSCTMMTMSSFNKDVVAKLLNENFYPVRIDATTRDTLYFGQEYINAMPEPGYHQLPIAMLNGKMKFPSLLVLNEDFRLLNTVQAYMTPIALETMLSYFASDSYKSISWQDFTKTFESKIAKSEKNE